MSSLLAAIGGAGFTALFGLGGMAQTQYPQGLAQYQQIVAMQNAFGMLPRCSMCPHCQAIEAENARRFIETMRAATEQRRKVVLERITKRKITVLSQMSVERWN